MAQSQHRDLAFGSTDSLLPWNELRGKLFYLLMTELDSATILGN
jgi:hypothetical protein